MSWTFNTSGAAINKAGLNANATIVASGAALEAWSDEAENIICDIAKVDLITNYSSLTSNGKQVLGSIASAMIAQNIINYDIGAIGSREAETRLDLLENQIRRGIQLIEQGNIKAYIAAE